MRYIKSVSPENYYSSPAKLVDIDAMSLIRFKRQKQQSRPVYIQLPKNTWSIKLPLQKKEWKKRVRDVFQYPRSCVIAVSYNFRNSLVCGKVSEKAKQKAKANTADCIDYLYRYEDSLGFDSIRSGLKRDDVHSMFDNDAVFKIMVSPENPEVLDEKYIKDLVGYLESKTGIKLKWSCTLHGRSEHPHAHILISRTEGEGLSWETPLRISPSIIKDGLRRKAIEQSNSRLGMMSRDEYRSPYYRTIRNIGPARIDYAISGNMRKGTNLFIDQGDGRKILSKRRLSALPAWKQALVLRRLSFLSANFPESGIRRDNDNWVIYMKSQLDVMGILRLQQRIAPFANILNGKEPIAINETRPVDKPIEGEIIAINLIDENSGKHDILLKDKEGKIYIFRAEFAFSEAQGLKGATARIENRNAKSKRYQLPRITIIERHQKKER